jgi:hypothetical protein
MLASSILDLSSRARVRRRCTTASGAPLDAEHFTPLDSSDISASPECAGRHHRILHGVDDGVSPDVGERAIPQVRRRRLDRDAPLAAALANAQRCERG